MTLEKQIAWIQRRQYFHQGEPEAVEALAAIKKSMEDYQKQNIKKTNGYERYQDFVAAYDLWMREKQGVGARMNGVEGKAMKAIIKYLIRESNDGDEEGALAAWHYILANWHRLSDFIKKQVSLSLINKNLVEILTSLRNYGKGKGTDAAKRIMDAG